MTIKEAAFTILNEVGEPLHYEEITRRTLEQGLWQTHGQTPSATLSAELYVDVRKHGDASRFRCLGKGMFAANGTGDQRLTPARVPNTPPQDADDRSLSFADAAEQVLERFGERES